MNRFRANTAAGRTRMQILALLVAVLAANWHTVRVDLQLPPDLSVNNLTARTRVGYFAPGDGKEPLGGKEK